MSNTSNLIPALGDLTKAQKIKLIIASIVLALCVMWIGYNLLVSDGPKVGKVPDSPAWITARDISAKLHENQAFLDVGLSVRTEQPLRFHVQGAVYSQNSMEQLKAKLKELRPEDDYDFDVELLKK